MSVASRRTRVEAARHEVVRSKIADRSPEDGEAILTGLVVSMNIEGDHVNRASANIDQHMEIGLPLRTASVAGNLRDEFRHNFNRWQAFVRGKSHSLKDTFRMIRTDAGAPHTEHPCCLRRTFVFGTNRIVLPRRCGSAKVDIPLQRSISNEPGVPMKPPSPYVPHDQCQEDCCVNQTGFRRMSFQEGEFQVRGDPGRVR